MTRVTQLIHDAGKYLLISVYPLPTHPTHNFTPQNGGNLETLPGWPKKLQHNRPARSAGQLLSPVECVYVLTGIRTCGFLYIRTGEYGHLVHGLKPCPWFNAPILALTSHVVYLNHHWSWGTNGFSYALMSWLVQITCQWEISTLEMHLIS